MCCVIRTLRGISLVVLMGLLLGTTIAAARADSPAVSGTSASFGIYDAYQTLGWQFSTNADVTVDALGYFDIQTNGLETSHQVGIWDSAGTLLTSATVDAGTTDPLINFFRYQSIAPYLLPAGHAYTIGGTAGAYNPPAPYDVWAYNVVGLTTDPAIALPANAARFLPTAGDTLVDPTLVGVGNVLWGPNFLIGPAPSAVPEPASMTLPALGSLALARRVRRRRAIAA